MPVFHVDIYIILIWLRGSLVVFSGATVSMAASEVGNKS